MPPSETASNHDAPGMPLDAALSGETPPTARRTAHAHTPRAQHTFGANALTQGAAAHAGRPDADASASKPVHPYATRTKPLPPVEKGSGEHWAAAPKSRLPRDETGADGAKKHKPGPLIPKLEGGSAPAEPEPGAEPEPEPEPEAAPPPACEEPAAPAAPAAPRPAMMRNAVPARVPRCKFDRIGTEQLTGFVDGRILVDGAGHAYKEEADLGGFMRIVRPFLYSQDGAVYASAKAHRLDLGMLFKEGGGEILDVIGAYNNRNHVLPARLRRMLDRQNTGHLLGDYVARARSPESWKTIGGVPMRDGKTYDFEELQMFLKAAAYELSDGNSGDELVVA